MFLMRVAAATLAALVLCLGSAEAKNITRSCDGYYEMQASLLDGIPPAAPLSWTMGDFATTASCGSTEPNHCRVIARDRIFRCFREHFAARWSRKRPEICRQLQRYGIDDIKTVIEQQVCCSEAARPYRNISITLYGATKGDGPCSTISGMPGMFQEKLARKSMVAPDYKMDCAALRAQLCPAAGSGGLRIEHLFDRPGSDYRSFETKSRNKCRDACKKEARCKAFTWERELPVQKGKCWLKDAVPPRVASKCCDSGYK